MLLRRPVIIALLLCAGATSTMMYRRSTAVQASPAVAASMHGALQGGVGVLGARRASVMRAGLFAMPQLSLADIGSAPQAAFGDGFTLRAMPASLTLTPSRSDFMPLPDDVGPPSAPIRDATKKGMTIWPEVIRTAKGDRRPDRGAGENVAYMVSGDPHVLMPKTGARPMGRLSRKLQPPETAEGLQQFQPSRLSAIVVTKLAERLSIADAELGGHDGAVPLDHSLAPAGGMSPAASRPDLASLTSSTTRADEALPVELAMAEPGALQPVVAQSSMTLANVQPVMTPDDAQTLPEIGSDEGLTDAQKKSRIAGLPGLDDGKARPLDLPPAAFTKAQMCLATAIYFEARGESREGQVAVAQVIINRLRSPFYPKNVCDVVYQGASNKRYGGCQFSFACDLVADKVIEKEPWEQALVLAERVMNAKDWIPEVGNATHYHANYVRPRWVRDMREKDKIGKHIFYRVKWWA
ncbi:cell wall hydrolase [Labrys sp. 22185]|uniref:cell wall hydrolase n=1 Tax=Labrys sp. 22185 TaxID=3453888 RepID=UPI003F846E0F